MKKEFSLNLDLSFFENYFLKAFNAQEKNEIKQYIQIVEKFIFSHLNEEFCDDYQNDKIDKRERLNLINLLIIASCTLYENGNENIEKLKKDNPEDYQRIINFLIKSKYLKREFKDFYQKLNEQNQINDQRRSSCCSSRERDNQDERSSKDLNREEIRNLKTFLDKNGFKTTTFTYGNKKYRASGEVKFLKLGWYHSGMVISVQNNYDYLYMWGKNTNGQIGDNSIENVYEPKWIGAFERITAFDLGENHSGLVEKNKDLYMWGDNDSGQLGNGDALNLDKHIPTFIKSFEEITLFSLGGHHSGLINKNSDLYMWGDNSFGQLGDKTMTNKNLPTLIRNFENVTSFALGSYYSGLIDDNKDLYMWGYNNYGQLGDGTTKDKHIPTYIESFKNATKLNLGGYHSGLVDRNNDLYMWGWNAFGQLGTRRTIDRIVPTLISHSFENITDFSLGWTHSGLVDQNSKLYMWGDNSFGQVGNGTTTNEFQPLLIANFENITAFNLGIDHSALINNNEELYSWGLNAYGQLGDGTTEDKHEPVKINFQ